MSLFQQAPAGTLPGATGRDPLQARRALCDDCTSRPGKPNRRPRVKLIPQAARTPFPGCQLGWSATCASQTWARGFIAACHPVPGPHQRCPALALKRPPRSCLSKANLGRSSRFQSRSRARVVPLFIAQAAALGPHHLVTPERQRHRPPTPCRAAFVGSRKPKLNLSGELWFESCGTFALQTSAAWNESAGLATETLPKQSSGDSRAAGF